ncbi:MAG: insulinase family protein [Nocardioidaceae bacterium]|nr:insulinase family protein [Nocardioidaceae bacterium]
MGGVQRTILPGGLRVVTEVLPGVRSAAVGVFVGVGSRDETPALSGASHFLEHLLFKGTPERTAMEISASLDAVGGEFNAYTAKEYTCYHARVLDEDLPLAIDILGDMLTASLLTSDDVEAEREVILDEIAMHDDDPEDVVHNLFSEHGWAGTPLGKPIAGRPETIRALTRTQVNRYYRSRYTAPRTTVAVAGNVDHDDVVRRVQVAFARRDFLADNEATPEPPRAAANPRRLAPGESRATRPSEQVNLVLGSRGITRSDPRRHALSVLSTALGGGTSSRLFQEVREQRGLAYSVYAFASSYSDAGMVGLAAGCLPAKLDEVLQVSRSVVAEVARNGITDEELARSKGMLRGGLVLGLEDTGSRMSRLGEAELFHERLLEVDEVLERIEKVSQADVTTLAESLFSGFGTLAVVGPA